MQMVTRYCIVDRQGRAWTGYEDEFSFDDDAALEYRDIDEAWEDAQQFEGVEIETFQRLSLIRETTTSKERAAA